MNWLNPASSWAQIGALIESDGFTRALVEFRRRLAGNREPW